MCILHKYQKKGNLYLLYPETIISSSREAFYPAAITSFHQKSPPQIEDSTNQSSQISLTMPSGKWASHSIALRGFFPRNQWGIQLASLSNASIRGDKPDKHHKAFQEKKYSEVRKCSSKQHLFFSNENTANIHIALCRSEPLPPQNFTSMMMIFPAAEHVFRIKNGRVCLTRKNSHPNFTSNPSRLEALKTPCY